MVDQRMDVKRERRNGIARNNGIKSNVFEIDAAVDSTMNIGDTNGCMELKLNSKHLEYLSEDFGLRMKNLRRLDLANNKLNDLPQSMQSMKRLETLILNKNRLTILPHVITQMRSLRVLEISGNRIKTLPDNFGDIKLLEILNLSSNCLSNLPDSCDKLRNLKTLDLSNNVFKTLPTCIVRGVRSLENLDVSNNFYINIAMPPSGKKLKRLYMRKCGSNVKFPVWCLRGRAPDLEVLICDGTRFKIFDFPKDYHSLKLRVLSMDGCSVYDGFMDEITKRLDDLVCLRLGNENSSRFGNAFWKIPIKNLKRPKLVESISVRATGIHSVCPEIGNFVNLTILDLSCNIINRLPDEICRLSKLEILLVEKNGLSSLPNDVGNLTSLKELRANGNHIAELPQSMKDLKRLIYLDLYNNEFQQIPENLNHIESLLGLDIDENDFEVMDFSIRDTKYEDLRNRLRDRYEIVKGSRLFGARYGSLSDEISDSVSDISSVACDDRVKTSIVNEIVTNDEENWDISDNSADEFDPNCETVEIPKQKMQSFRDVLWNRFAFCPADLHSLSIRHQATVMKQRGNIVNVEPEEGQFDDAD